MIAQLFVLAFGFRDADVQVVADEEYRRAPVDPQQDGEQGAQGAIDEVVVGKVGEVEVNNP